MDWLFEAGFGFLLVLSRTSGLVVTMPVVSARFIPMRIRMALAMACSVAAYLGAGSPRVAVPDSIFELAGAGFVEGLVGLLAGLSARLLLDAAASAGTYAASIMGLNYGSMLDPFHGASSNAVTELTNILAVSFAVAAGMHREGIVWLAKSFALHPPGTLVNLSSAMLATIGQATHGLALGVRLGFPFMMVTSFGHVVFAFVGRSAPQLNVSSLGFSVSLLAGGAALYLAAPIAAELAVRAAMHSLGR